MKLIARSYERYNGGVKAKRQYGSSTLTSFYVFRPEDERVASRWADIKGVGGRTPGDRATRAKERAEPIIIDILKRELDAALKRLNEEIDLAKSKFVADEEDADLDNEIEHLEYLAATIIRDKYQMFSAPIADEIDSAIQGAVALLKDGFNK